MKNIAAEVRTVDAAPLVSRAKKLQANASTNSWDLADCYLEMKERLGWSDQKVADACEVHMKHVQRFRACAERWTLVSNRPTFWEAFQEVVSPGAHVSQNTGNNEWYTPTEYVEAARQAMGGIDLDPASCALANDTVEAKRFYTEEDDGLEKKWKGKVWMNPPYAQPLCAQFTKKVADEYEAGNIEAATVLVNNGTETEWFQTLVKKASALCFPRSRIKFIDTKGEASGAPLQGQVVLYLGKDVKAFKEAYSPLGPTFGLDW